MKFKNVISSQISNLFQKRGEVEPAIIVKNLEREVMKQKKLIDGLNFVPNDYVIFLSEEDCHRLSAARFIKELYETVERKVIRENLFMNGRLSVRIEKNSENDDPIVIKSQDIKEKNFEEDTINLANDILSHTLIEDSENNSEETIIADKKKITSSMRTVSGHTVEYELAILGDMSDEKIFLGERQVYIGRKENNDFVLKDDGASRVHAYISYERHRHVLRDAGSLNGTFVNKKQIDRYILNDGDKILIGSTTLIYKVL
ncbi:MAG: DUF3662 domain-containing protein [Selenomonadaceae bacterium]|nr:DUF3662 domain-containing protein [Selenomonadaceae bacterium]